MFSEEGRVQPSIWQLRTKVLMWGLLWFSDPTLDARDSNTARGMQWKHINQLEKLEAFHHYWLDICGCGRVEGGRGQSGVIDKKLPSQLRQYCLCCRSTLLSQSHNSPGNSYSVNGDNRKFFDGNATGYTVTVTRLWYSSFVIVSDYELERNIIRLMVQYRYNKGIVR